MNKEESDIMQELQSLWDSQDDRLAVLSARPEAQPRGLDVRELEARGGLFFRLAAPHNRKLGQHFWRYAAAAAIALLLVIGLWLFNTRPEEKEPLEARNQTETTVPETQPADEHSSSTNTQQEPLGKEQHPYLHKPIMPTLQEPLIAAVDETDVTKETAADKDEAQTLPPVESRKDDIQIGFGEGTVIPNKAKTPAALADDFISSNPRQDRRYVLEGGLSWQISAISASFIADDSYIGMGPGISAFAGRRNGGFMVGLECDVKYIGSGNFEHDWHAWLGDLSLEIRNYAYILKGVECYGALKAGLSAMSTTIVETETEGSSDIGLSLEAEGGLTIDLTEKTYVGLRAAVELNTAFGKKDEQPQLGPAKKFAACSISVAIGTKF